MNKFEKIRKSDVTRTRVLEAAIQAFARGGLQNASIAEIAREAGLTSPAVYRYFSSKRDLYYGALEYDFDSIQNSVLRDMEDSPLSAVNGEIFQNFVAKVDDHPLAKAAVITRQPEILDFTAKLDSTKRIHEKLENDVKLGQKYGLIRSDIVVEVAMESAHFIYTHMLLPLLFEKKLNSPEWMKISNVLIASLFHPMPDLTTPENFQKYVGRLDEVIGKILTDRLNVGEF